MKHISDNTILLSSMLLCIGSAFLLWPLAEEFNTGGWNGLLSIMFALLPIGISSALPCSILWFRKYTSDKEKNYLQTRKNIAEFIMRCRK